MEGRVWSYQNDATRMPKHKLVFQHSLKLPGPQEYCYCCTLLPESVIEVALVVLVAVVGLTMTIVPDNVFELSLSRVLSVSSKTSVTER